MGQATKELERDALVQRELLELLRKDAGWLFERQIEQGAEYLELHFGTGSVRERVRDSKGFWVWFRNQWGLCDRNLLPSLAQTPTGLRCYVPGILTVTFGTLGEWRRYYLRRHQRQVEQLRMDSQELADILSEGR